jgi:short-subunit dehydrogenase
LPEWVKITYGEKGIGVSCLCPQAVRTAMTAQGPGVAGVDGMMEPDVVAHEVLKCIAEGKISSITSYRSRLSMFQEREMIETDGYQECRDFKSNTKIF